MGSLDRWFGDCFGSFIGKQHVQLFVLFCFQCAYDAESWFTAGNSSLDHIIFCNTSSWFLCFLVYGTNSYCVWADNFCYKPSGRVVGICPIDAPVLHPVRITL